MWIADAADATTSAVGGNAVAILLGVIGMVTALGAAYIGRRPHDEDEAPESRVVSAAAAASELASIRTEQFLEGALRREQQQHDETRSKLERAEHDLARVREELHRQEVREAGRDRR